MYFLNAGPLPEHSSESIAVRCIENTALPCSQWCWKKCIFCTGAWNRGPRAWNVQSRAGRKASPDEQHCFNSIIETWEGGEFWWWENFSCWKATVLLQYSGGNVFKLSDELDEADAQHVSGLLSHGFWFPPWANLNALLIFWLFHHSVWQNHSGVWQNHSGKITLVKSAWKNHSVSGKKGKLSKKC